MTATKNDNPTPVRISHEDFMRHLMAPFGGRETHDAQGNPLPSSKGVKWTFTLANSKTGTHLTFRSRRPTGWTIDSPVLVDVMAGPDNGDDFLFLGSVSRRGGYKPSTKSKATGGHGEKAHRTMQWIVSHLLQDSPLPDALVIMGSRKCAKCGQKLTRPESLQIGLGPVCRTIV